MPLQNRVRPDGEIITTSARGTFLGNRGILHDENKRIVRQSRSDMWLICQLQFNGRQQEIMHPKRYTQLFFLDEAVALAAGHRPCGECRRKYYRAYIDAANVDSDTPIAGSGDLDRRLRVSRRSQRTSAPVDSLPEGAFISLGGEDFRLVWEGSLYRWSPDGYAEPITVADCGIAQATVITPALSLRALRHGYPVTVHPSVAAAAPVTVVSESSLAPRVRAQPAPMTRVPTAGGLSDEHRAEVEQILRASSPGLTHGEVFRYLEQGLDVDEISARHGSSVANVRSFMRSLTHLFEGTVPDTGSAARTNAFVYKELLNHPLSPGLLSYVQQRLRQLIGINPEITMEPLRTRGHQYKIARPRAALREAPCARCHRVHPGECD